MATSKYKSPHDRALIAFAANVLATMEHNHDWSADTMMGLDISANKFGLATTDDAAEFRVIPRARFRNPLSL